MANNRLSTYNPAVVFLFFMGAIVLGMFFIHPLFLCVSVLLSAVYYLSLKGAKGGRLIGVLMIIFIGISVINPVFNTLGDTTLFTYSGGRRYTLEALAYGAATGMMFISVMLWFACYNLVMTSDKFIYLFGRLMPSISLILTMVLRLVPRFQKKLAAISGARKCIGMAGGGTRSEKTMHAAATVSALTSWALEGTVESSDAMRSRGYGLPGRTSFNIYRFGKRDIAMITEMLLLISLVIVCATQGVAYVRYIPTIELPGMTTSSIIGVTAYAVFLSIPSVMKFSEDIKWRILRSKI